MKLWVGVTDNDWYEFLASQKDIDEVNFWQPGGRSHFGVLSPGEPFLFKLHSPENYIVGGGFFAHATRLPLNLAWESFEQMNGAASPEDMREMIEKFRRSPSDPKADYIIGCILLEQPFFFKREDWIRVPSDFSLNIVQGKSYETSFGTGKVLWERVQEILSAAKQEAIFEGRPVEEVYGLRHGKPTLVLPRLGQGAFRVLVTDAYQRRCAVTRERTLPALEAGHIKPFGRNGPHRIDNGLLLRRDIHRLFDLGYVTVTSDHRFEVSKRIKEEFENGRDYYSLRGTQLLLPSEPALRPAREFLNYHAERVFRG